MNNEDSNKTNCVIDEKINLERIVAFFELLYEWDLKEKNNEKDLSYDKV